MNSVSDALALCRRGRTEEAEALCRHLIAQPAAAADALALLADLQLQSGRLNEAVASLRQLVGVVPDSAAHRRRLGGALFAAGEAAEAASEYQKSLELEPGNVRGHNNLGQSLLSLGRAADAVAAFERALALEPSYAIGWNNLGLAWLAAGNAPRAADALRRAVALDSNLAPARLNLADALARAGQLTEALAEFDRAVAIFPANVEAWSGRGALSLQLHRLIEAVDDFETALKLRPHDARVLALKSNALLASQRTAEALGAAERALAAQPDLFEALTARAAALSRLNRSKEALESLRRALQRKPDAIETWCHAALVHQSLADPAGAAECYREALRLDPDFMAARTGLLSAMIPAVPPTAAAIRSARAAFEAGIGELEQWLTDRPPKEEDCWTLAQQTLFYLSYDDESNKPLLQRYRHASATLLSETYGTAPLAVPSPTLAGRIRLGIVSAHLRDHSVYNAIVQGWLRRLDRTQFDTTLFSLETADAVIAAAAAQTADQIEIGPRSLKQWAELIGNRRLDILLYPEVGIDRGTLALAHLRLAPRQLAAWGHPETTGLPTIDAFLSAESFEPPDADRNYSEQLIRLPNLGAYYEPYEIAAEPIDLARWNVPQDRAILLCCGTPFKYRPEDDAVLIDIARRVGACTFIFFIYEKAGLSHALQARLRAAFARAGLNADDFIRWIPWLPRPAFFGLLAKADVFLDSIGFSGFNTVMQAVQANLPVVTHDGQFMRGRFGSGILRQLGIPELIATDRREYVEIAVRLAHESGWRKALRERMRQSEHRLYRDERVVDALEKVLRDATHPPGATESTFPYP